MDQYDPANEWLGSIPSGDIGKELMFVSSVGKWLYAAISAIGYWL